MKKLLLFAMVGILASNAYSADWKLVGRSDKTYAFVDDSSIVAQKANRKAWIMWSDIEEDSKPSSGSLPVTRSAKVLSHFNCAERTSADVQRITYSGFGGEGESITSQKYTVSPASFFEVVPDTVGETIFNYICGKKLK